MKPPPLRVFVINMASSTARLEKITTELAACGIPFERIEAVNGMQLPDAMRCLSPFSRFIVGRRLLPQEIGCWLSHRLVWERIVAEQIPQALVLEDDASPCVTYDDLLQVDPAAVGLDLLRLHVLKHHKLVANCRHTLFRQAGRDVVLQTYPRHSTTAYVITLSGARKLLSMKRILAPLDWFSLWAVQVGLRHGILLPNLFNAQIDESSTIGTRDSIGWPRLHKHIVRRYVLRHFDRWLVRQVLSRT